MARILLATMPFAGHVSPVRALAAELIDRGHDVRVYTASRYAASFSRLGARIVPWRAAPDFDEFDLTATFPRLGRRTGRAAVFDNLREIFIGVASAQADDLLAEWERERWDCLVNESSLIGTAMVAEKTPAPWVTLAVLPLSLPSRSLPPGGLGVTPRPGLAGSIRDAGLRALSAGFLRVLQGPLDEQWRRQGLPSPSRSFVDVAFSPTLILATGTKTLDFDRPDPPAELHYVGLVRNPVDMTRPPWWDSLMAESRPIVHLTQGTLNTDPGELLQPAIEALSGQGIALAVTTGRRGTTVLPFPVPDGVYVTDLLPQDDLLPHCAAMITNGGWGGVLAAAAAGVPLIVAGAELDKPEVAARVGYAGIGVDLRTGSPTPSAVLRAWRDSRQADTVRRAEDHGLQMRALGGAARAADLLEEILEGRR